MWNVLALIAVEYAVTAVVSEVWDAVVDDWRMSVGPQHKQ